MYQRFYFLLFISLLYASLSACSLSTGGVKGAYPGIAPKYTEGMAAGLVVGASVVGDADDAPLGAVLGAILGGSIGSYYDGEGLIRELAKQGITVIQLGDTVEVILPDDIIFETASSTIKYEAYPLLNQIVFFLKQYGYVHMAIVGHSDVVGTNAGQIHQSSLQAQSVATYVWSHGINIDRIEVYGVGVHDTIADLHSVEGNGYNRRVEIYFWRNGKQSPFKALVVGFNADCWTSAELNNC